MLYNSRNITDLSDICIVQKINVVIDDVFIVNDINLLAHYKELTFDISYSSIYPLEDLSFTVITEPSHGDLSLNEQPVVERHLQR